MRCNFTMSDQFFRTCYIDMNDRIAGHISLYGNGGEVIADFDARMLYVGDKEISLPESNFRVLESLVIFAPGVVVYDELFNSFYNDSSTYDNVDEEKAKRVLRNCIHNLSRYIEIDNVQSKGYKIFLDKKIKKFTDIDKDFVHDISEVFPEISVPIINTEPRKPTKKTQISALEFSKKFFHSGANEMLGKSAQDCLDSLSGLSGIFDYVATVDGCVCEDVIRNAYELIVDGCRYGSEKNVFRINGPLGSYKNRIMQYIYLAIEKNNSDIVPFFVDIASYERMAETEDVITEVDIISAFVEDIEAVGESISHLVGKTPLLMIDGIRDFSRGNEALYHCMSRRIDELDCKIVVCIDSDFTVNNQHRFEVHPLVPDDFMHSMSIDSMDLYKRRESIEFIRNTVKVSGVELPSSVTPEKVYENLVRLHFFTVDAYWLVFVLKNNLQEFMGRNSNIATLYNAICIETLGSRNVLDSAAELAFEFEFGSMDSFDAQANFDVRWRLIRRHRSVLDFLIAKHYINKIEKLVLTRTDMDADVRSLSFFNMVLQKNITRFVVEMLNSNEHYEHKIMIIAEDYYNYLSLFGKSELTFWMARLGNKVRRGKCINLLKNFNNTEIQRYKTAKFTSVEEKRNAAFLIRGISVSLIHENDKKTLALYLKTLLTDKTANSVNRGFHLEYYGDKPYIPNQSLLDFEDDVTKGENTFNVLCLSLDRKMKNKETPSPMALLELMTLCNLVQARMEAAEREDIFDITHYVPKVISFIKWTIKSNVFSGMADVARYFMWMHDELETVKESGAYRYSLSGPYDKFSCAKIIKRKGWINCKVPEPENIVEHMYNCWLVGMLYLPEQSDAAGYSKERILNMLLIHDLAERETDDISRPDKQRNLRFYDRQENDIMQSFMLSGTYPSAVSLNKYSEAWNEWDAKSSVNYSIAKDIDNIQTVYQFCEYYKQNPELFTDEDIDYWLSDVNELNSEIGREIAGKLIVANPNFTNIVKSSSVINER